MSTIYFTLNADYDPLNRSEVYKTLTFDPGGNYDVREFPEFGVGYAALNSNTGNGPILFQSSTSGTSDLFYSNAGYFFDFSDNIVAVRITGGAFGDILSAGTGNDTLDGGAGSDTLIGSTGDDSYVVDSSTDRVAEASGQGADTIYASVDFIIAANVESLTATAADLTLVGNAVANQLSDFAGGGTLLIGGAGDDKYYVRNSASTINDSAGADTVYADTSYTLRAAIAVERLEAREATGVGAINLVGNELAQTITGNDGANMLLGNGGNDVISARGGADGVQGGLGNDTVAGNGGNDNFYFNTALNASTNVDRILDFGQATGNADLIRLDKAIFTLLGPTAGFLKAANFAANADGLAADGNDFIVFETDTGKLFYDANGSTAGGATQFATLTNYASLTGTNALGAGDFYVY